MNRFEKTISSNAASRMDTINICYCYFTFYTTWGCYWAECHCWWIVCTTHVQHKVNFEVMLDHKNMVNFFGR